MSVLFIENKMGSITNAINEFEPMTKTKSAKINEKHDKILLEHGQCSITRFKNVKKKYLDTLKWNILPTTPYSPDVALSNLYYLFRSMVRGLATEYFRSNKEVKHWIDFLIASNMQPFIHN